MSHSPPSSTPTPNDPRNHRNKKRQIATPKGHQVVTFNCTFLFKANSFPYPAHSFWLLPHIRWVHLRKIYLGNSPSSKSHEKFNHHPSALRPFFKEKYC